MKQAQETQRSQSLALNCQDISKTFGDIQILKGINLSVQQGEIVVISRRSGMGKSTLMAILAGLDQPSTGAVTLAGHSLAHLSNQEMSKLRRTSVGFIFQRFNLLPSWTALENVEVALRHANLSKPKRQAHASQCLSELGLNDRLGHLPVELSVGQQQRVAVARALAHRPAIIFADEPTGDVDPETGQEILEILVQAVRRWGSTLIVVTHGNFTLTHADRQFTLAEGELKETDLAK
ncbi:ABC transporter ATP-binding protein [Planctomycetota bacterium]